ncbi:hypothetical protein HHI36_012427 [Cryptolaemus montrouzieri]|uniref:C2 domain-containing protein n=1 Tax=Cryptolaemus montrouzieri TaxID=559131 RepID=A0ABD2NEF1_9CUCU
MPEELLNSGSSQGSTNPRLRSTQRVRAVPYECCGGLCSFLNTGCFSMCCGVQKSRSYDKKRRDSRQLLPKKQELSESSKKVIKPNSDDGITDVDFEAFQSDPEDDFYHKNEKPGDDLFISETETDEKQNNDAVDEEKSSACLLHDNSRSEITDGISVTGSEVSKKSKKSLMSILGIKKKKKIQDSMSLASLPRSVEMNEPVSAESEVTDPWKTLEKSSLLFEKCSLKSKSQEFILEESSDPKSGSTNVASSATDLSEDDVIISEAHSSPTLGSKSGSKSATPSPIAAKSRSGTLSSTNSEWQNAEEDIDRLMVMQGRNSLSSLGLRSDSMASVYSGAGEGRYGTVTVRGQVEFGLQYNYKAGALEIHVKQCRDLAPVDTKRNRSDPYVKVYLLPDKSKGGKRKTKVKKHTLNPVFDETLKFHISLNGLETRTLWLTVWHSDMFGRNDFLGEVMMALENKVFDDPTPKLYNLQERTEPFDDTISFKGDIIVCLKFVPPDMTVQKKGKRSRGTLHVLVKEAKYLTAYKANGTSDPFCKSYLLPDKGRNSKQKTPVVRKTINPVWNHTFIYEDVTLQELAERCLELTVWDHDRLASNEFLGGVRFSLGSGKHYGKPVEWMDATGKEMTLWKSMLERPNFWVEGCLSLRPTLDARTS